MRLLVKPEGENNGACRLPILMEQIFDDGQEANQDILAVAGSSAPEPLAIEVASKRGVGPVGRIIYRYNVLVSHEQDRFK